MGRIRKALSITSVIATGGALGTPVKWESSAEKAAREQARLLREQNDLLARLARNGQAAVPASAPEVPLVCCVDCISQGCDEAMGADVGWTRSAALCDCLAHHSEPPLA
jgi:hypothetical protein